MNTADKTLVILSPGFPESESDTECLPAQQVFIQSLRKQFSGLEIIILAFEYPFTETSYIWHGCQVLPFNSWEKGRMSKLNIWLKIWKKLNQLNRQKNMIGILSFWCNECAVLGKYFAKVHAIKHYCWILGQDAKGDNRFVRWLRPRPEELIAMSDFLAAEFNRNHSVLPRYVIPNGIDCKQFGEPPSKRDIAILGAGSLIALKQYWILVDIVASSTKNHPHLHAMLCGKGPEEAALRFKIESLRINEQITLTGEISHSDILKLMQRSRIFLHPSSYEGFSTVCLEALYAGAQVISFCQPMNKGIPNWHIAANKEHMLQIASQLLDQSELPAISHLPFPISDNARAILRLYDPGSV